MKPRLNKKWLSEDTIGKSTADIRAGLKLCESVDRPFVSIIGSAREQVHEILQFCERLTFTIGRETGLGVLTGGGGGIMNAANKGAFEAGTVSAAISSEALMKMEGVNGDYHTHSVVVKDVFFGRRFLILTIPEAIVAFPGGLGTRDEFYEHFMLMQQRKVDIVPFILVEDGREYWTNELDHIKRDMLTPGYISPEDLDLITDVVNIAKMSTKVAIGRILGHIIAFQHKLSNAS